MIGIANGTGTAALPDTLGDFEAGHSSIIERITAWRFLPFDTYPGVIAFAETPSGKVILLALFAPLLRPLSHLWFLITIAAAACAFAGRYRSRLVTLITLGTLALYFFHRPDGRFISLYWINWDAPSQIALREHIPLQIVFRLNWLAIALVFLLSGVAMHLMRSFASSTIAHRPILSLHIFFVFLVLLAASRLLHGMSLVMLWSFITTLGAYFWFLCYALVDQRAMHGSPAFIQLGLFHPFWGSSTTPIGKGAAYLRSIEAKNAKGLAITQLKGLKLLMWVWVLKLVLNFLEIFIHAFVKLPSLDEAFARHLTVHPYSQFVCWITLVYQFLHNMLYVAIWGDTIVACGRLAGYRMLRNSYRPLSSRTLADFWNRYYYYFKELLVAFFFFPTFLRYFKRFTRLRTFAATFMAAAVGNFIFHFMKGIGAVAESGLWRGLLGFQIYAFYCVVLATGIGLSQMRSQKRKIRESWLKRQVLPSLGVLFFYCLLEVFAVDTYSPYSLRDCFSFLFYLFGVGA